MPFQPGQTVDIRFIGNPDTSVFRCEGLRAPLTVANGGLVMRRKSALHAVFKLPTQPGKYAYEFESDGEVRDNRWDSGHVRVTTGETRRKHAHRVTDIDSAQTGEDLRVRGGVRARRHA